MFRLSSITLLFLMLCNALLFGQNMQDYNGSWKGQFPTQNTFNFNVEVEQMDENFAVFKISNEHEIVNKVVDFNAESFEIIIHENLSFRGVLNENKSEINGFMHSGLLLYHLTLKRELAGYYVGTWNIFMIDEMKALDVFLSVENGNEDHYEAYPIFADNRFTGTWCGEFKKENSSISFNDLKTGLIFKGKLAASAINLRVYLGSNLVTEILLTPFPNDWELGGIKSDELTEPKKLKDGWEVSNVGIKHPEILKTLEDSIRLNSFVNTQSVLIARNGQLVYENYFSGFNGNIPQDMRSASKSISSAIIGICIHQQLIKNEHEKLFKYLPEKYALFSTAYKKRITLKSLLTMSSGLDAIDFGIESDSYASEDNYQQKMDFTKYILSAPMLYKPGIHANYGSANPYLLGVVANEVVSQPLSVFMDENLFQPLGISNYIMQTDRQGSPYFGGGMYLTPRDMLKFGQLYLNKGVWNNQQIIAPEWIEKSLKNYLILENTRDKNGYGYLWWHHQYQIEDKIINTIEARGAGGQYIFLIPSLNATVVITSANFRNGKFQQPEKILKQFILPALFE